MIRRIGRCVMACPAVFAACVFALNPAEAAGKDVVFMKAFYPFGGAGVH